LIKKRRGIMFTIDIDTGGTFTDGFFTRDGEIKTVKVLTTPHDLTVCLINCIKEGAEQFGVSLKEALLNSDIIRYSSTTGVNTLITRTGSKIGLIVSKGYKESLYSNKPEEVEPVYSLISRDLILEVEEAIDHQGNVVKSLEGDEVLSKMQYLIDMGARAITVSLKNSHLNPTHERQVKQIIKEQYPNYYLGSVRVFLASEISDQPGDFYRTNAVVINGYVHDSLVKYLYKAEDDLRENLCPHPLMVAHSHGGVARVAKTRAIDTYASGPALGVIGAGNVAAMYGFRNVLTVDIGGTSLDLGFIRNGVYSYDLIPSIAGLPVTVPMITTYSAALAGGSIASLDTSRNLQVGPKSAGARPGPACFDLGGVEPTVTDADVALGFIDPNYFLGGRIRLNRGKAISAVKTRIADPLKMSVEEAASLIREETGIRTQKEILRFLKGQGIETKDLSDFAVVVYGGAGPTHFCDFAKGLSFGNSLASPYAAVFSAFGSSTTDLVHTYSRYVRIDLFNKGKYLTDYEELNKIIGSLLEIAKNDIWGEGFPPEKALFFLEMVGDKELFGLRIKTNKMSFHSEKDVKELCSLFAKEGGGEREKVSISTLVLNALVPMPHLKMKASKLSKEDPNKALKGHREVFWSHQKGYQKTPIYERALLLPGNVVMGPAIVEAKDTTYIIPANHFFKVDKYLNGRIEEA
jgi:N-methylhydantoinase A/acetophenone carboxylase